MISKTGKSGIPGSFTARERPSETLPGVHSVAYPANTRKQDRELDLGRSPSKGKLDSTKSVRDDTDSAETSASDPMVIRKTTDWVIRYDYEQR